MRRALSLALCLLFSSSLLAATFGVNDPGDASDLVPGDGVCDTAPDASFVCTLRAAIQEANALAGADTIAVAVAGTIAPVTALPTITTQVTVSGVFVPGYGGVPLVNLDGGGTLVTGLSFAAGSDGSTLEALQIYGFTASAVSVSSANVRITRNYLGPVTGGTPNMDGLTLFGTNTVVGGNNDGDGNVISGNSRMGILAAGSGHAISDNYIGTDATGTVALPNAQDGVRLFSNATDIVVGGFSPNTENVISGNAMSGVRMDNVDGNRVAANFIGLDASGMNALPNLIGVDLTGGADNNEVGNGDSRLVVSGNSLAGVQIAGGSGNVVQWALIGLADDGLTPRPNDVGIRIQSSGNSVRDSFISGNVSHGIEILAANTTVLRNFIGTDEAGFDPVGNGGDGISITGVANTTIGDGAGGGNIISANVGNGIAAVDGVTGLLVFGNTIGLAADDSLLGNGQSGIYLRSSTGTIGAGGAAANVISGNAGSGILIETSSGNVIAGNRIGTDRAGAAPAGNSVFGVELRDATGTRISGNVISSNGFDGININGTSSATEVYANLIGLSGDSLMSFPNSFAGVSIAGSAAGNIIGSEAGGAGLNTIATNGGPGVVVMGTARSNTFLNATYDNGGPGIDLGNDGVTPNDIGDADAGPNDLQNFPLLTSAVSSGGGLTVNGTINTTPLTTVTLHFFSSITPDPSGNGEGRTFLGSQVVTTDALGTASFSFVGPAVPSGSVITATATAGAPTMAGTSEFSAAVGVAAAAEFSFSAPTYSVNEDAGTIAISVRRQGDLSAAVTVDYATADGTATAGSDYTAASGTLSFAPGEINATFNVAISDDTADEPLETIQLSLSNPSGGVIVAPATAVLEINDNDVPAVSINDVSLAEGNAGSTSFVFTVSIPAVSPSDVTVDYVTSNGTATAGEDYATASGSVTIPAGSTSATISVAVNGDVGNETDETFLVTITNPVNASIADATGEGTIVNDDALPALSIADVTQAETDGPTTFSFVVTLSSASALPVTVNYATADGTATTGSDYTAAVGTLTFAPGVTSATIDVPVLGDSVPESGETFTVTLSAPSGATLADDSANGTITDDDAAPTLSIADVSRPETNGATTFTFVVSLSSASTLPVTVNYTTADGTATAGSDYATTSGTLTFAPGVTSATIDVPVLGDATPEGNETFTVTLTGAIGATLADAVATGTITNDDAAAVAAQIPTTSEWGLILLGLALGMVALVRMRQ